MEVVEFRPTREQYRYTFGGAEPVAVIDPGTALRLWTEDAFGGRIRRHGDLFTAVVGDLPVNPQTGPFHVRGAEPGDTLVLHIAALSPARDWGASCAIPGFGGLTSTGRTATLQDPLPERTWIYSVDRARGTVGFSALATDFTVDLPLAPMLGTVGVAPAQGEVRTSMAADAFGGNMDSPEVRAGTTCYLGVNVPGALFSVGDGHYRQGEGESCGTAVEGAMAVTLIVDLVKGHAPAWPRLESDDALAVIGSARPLEDAWRISQVDMVHWLADLHRLDLMDAYQLLSQTARTPLANVVDTNYSCVTKVDKALLPRVEVHEGVHDTLRLLAATV
ncbi:acetamidase/formamidase family protein [Actinokineospora enzanensis]|uniref:acetamidase/formamidase family protein n=1 Tax=Actinokineospora enzanensis TaxID=155975 RepID=UPI00036DCBD6|nr:acetamidase/formamidase family protein [Actinokineospora enzanensis]